MSRRAARTYRDQDAELRQVLMPAANRPPLRQVRRRLLLALLVLAATVASPPPATATSPRSAPTPGWSTCC